MKHKKSPRRLETRNKKKVKKIDFVSTNTNNKKVAYKDSSKDKKVEYHS